MKRVLLIGLGIAVVLLVVGLAVFRWTDQLAADHAAVAVAPADAVPLAAVQPEIPSFDIVRVDPQGRAVIAGRAAPGADVTILDGDHELGHVTADGRGEWVFLPENSLAPGNHSLSLTSRLPSDGTAAKSDGVVALLVPERAPTVADANQPPPSDQGTVAVLLPRKGNGAARALQVPLAPLGSASSPGIVLDIIQYGEPDTLSLSGRAAPKAHLEIFLDNRRVGRATADAEGRWATVLERVPPGRYQLRIDSLGANGQVLAHLALPFERLSQPGNAAFVMVQPGNSLWRIARRSYGSGFRYVEIYRANRDEIADPNLIYTGQLFALPQSR